MKTTIIKNISIIIICILLIGPMAGNVAASPTPIDATLLESPHPYPNAYDNTWTITEPGAEKMRIHFSYIEVEARRDFVYIYDKNDVEITRSAISNYDIWTPWVTGDTIKVRLVTNKRSIRNGFIVDMKETVNTEPPQLDVTMTQTNATLEAGQNMQVTIHALSKGMPVAEAMVGISTSGGYLSQTTGTTDTNGDFIATYTAPQVRAQTEFTISTTATKTGYTEGIGTNIIAINPVTVAVQNPPETIGPVSNLSKVKNAVLYERITDGALYGRSNDDVIELFKQTQTDLIFRGFWRWRPVPESRKSAPEEVYKLGGTQAELQAVLDYNYTYEDLKIAISGIKQEMPNVIFVGAIPAQRINGIDKNDMTGEILDKDKTWGMALDPEKWGIDVSKKDAQTKLGDVLGWSDDAYYPDITNPNYQQFLIDMAKKQIDCGADAIWIDMLFSQAILLERYTNDPNHPAVKESFDASSNIVDEIHAYGKRKGKYIYVGTWTDSVNLHYSQPKLDFVTLSPTSDMISGNNFDKTEWSGKKTKIRDKLGDIPIFVFIDWSNDNSPLVTFSQELSKAEQGVLLTEMDAFFKGEGMTFVLPLHGGFMGNQASILSFGNSKVYDSKAPEFGTFNNIEAIANND